MAKVKWAEGIEYVSGLLTKRPKAGSMHSDHCSALLATHRVAATENPVCTRLYMVGPYKRSTPLSSNELDARARFDQLRCTEGHGRWQKDHEGLPLESVWRHLRCCPQRLRKEVNHEQATDY